MPSRFCLALMSIMIRGQLAGVSGATLSRFVARAQREAKIKGEINVLITTSNELQRLNRDFRGKDNATDVLSFPSVLENGGGDIAISWQIAQANARTLGHSLADELKVLILHGTLHLAGHDHETDKGEMQRLEDRFRVKLGLADSLIERAAGTRVSLAKGKRSGAVGGRKR